jgi:hypothetical protein
MDKWRDKARIAALDETSGYIIIDGLRPRPLAFEGPMADLKAQGMDIPKAEGYRYSDNRPGTWDPNERLKDQDIDGVSGEVIYPGVGLTLVRAPDAEYLYACCRAYNDWLAEYCQPYPDRIKGVGMIPCRGPIAWAVAETERAGGWSASCFAWVDDRPYNLPVGTCWAAMRDMGVVAASILAGAIRLAVLWTRCRWDYYRHREV